MKRLPPLDALYVFSIVAREKNMSRAAELLFVTQSAVSRQIRQLEDHLGLAVFVRQARGIELTAAGRKLLPAAEQAFDGLHHAVESLLVRQTDLKIKLPPTFAIRWFMPRLAQFQQQYPEIEVRMSTASFTRIHFERENFDAAVVSGTQAPTDAYYEPLFPERLTPVCAPSVAARLHHPSDLAQESLIHLSSEHMEWRTWLAMAGVQHPALESGPCIEVIDMAVNVAAQGVGVAIADPLLLADDLSSGRLIAPFPTLVWQTDYHYWFACPRGRQTETPIAALRDWLVAGIATSSARFRA